MPVKPDKTLDISRKQLKDLQKRIGKRKLLESDYELLQGLAETVQCLSQALAEKEASIGRLVKYLLGAPTETARNVLGKQPEKPAMEGDQKEPGKRKGHGRTPASAYTGGSREVIDHPGLKGGDVCPGCQKGKVYELALPSVCVRITGEAPLKSTVYERVRLRCNLCGEIQAPELPPEAGDKKYDDSAAAMVALLKYGCGLPLNRLEKLQGHLGQPVPASTSWDILDAAAITLAPVHDSLVNDAAQGEILYNDDTQMKILSFLKEQDSDRNGLFTTGVISKHGDHHIALFMTGNQHAGENLTRVLKRRRTGLAPPVQMCDAASRNASKEFETILVNCLAHARRQFVELVDRFPDECSYMIEQLGMVYHHDAISRAQKMSPEERLAYHREHSARVMDEMEKWCRRQLDEKLVEPNSGLGKAIKYMLNHWSRLTGFLHVAGAPLDNNICERALKHAILHRKNALFYKTQHGARVGDLFMSLIHTCQLQGINPLNYLTWLLKHAGNLKESPEDYLPWRYTPG